MRAPSKSRAPRSYRVYVIESVYRGSIVFYVGQSAHAPAQRLLQHKQGVRYCGICTSRSYAKGMKLRLRPDLSRNIPPMKTREEAKRAESSLARKLRARGMYVMGGH